MGDQIITGGKNRQVQKRAAPVGGFNKTRRGCFLDTLAATCNVRLSARAAGIDPSYCYRVRARDPGFADAWRAALAMGYERLEEALVGYVVQRVEAAGIDPGAVDPAAVDGTVQASIEHGAVSNADLQFALALLNRHRGAVEGRARFGGRVVPRATREETDEALRNKLDSLARRMGGA